VCFQGSIEERKEGKTHIDSVTKALAVESFLNLYCQKVAQIFEGYEDKTFSQEVRLLACS